MQLIIVTTTITIKRPGTSHVWIEYSFQNMLVCPLEVHSKRRWRCETGRLSQGTSTVPKFGNTVKIR